MDLQPSTPNNQTQSLPLVAGVPRECRVLDGDPHVDSGRVPKKSQAEEGHHGKEKGGGGRRSRGRGRGKK